MKSGRRPTIAVASMALLLSTSVASAGPIEAFYKLEEQMAEAQESRMAARGDDARTPSADPRPDILKKIDALAVQTLDTPHGASIAAGAFYWSWNLDLDLANLPGRFQLLVDHYADDPTLDDVLPQAVFAGLASDKPASWADALSRLAATAKRKEAKVAALMALGKLRLGAKEPSEAKTAFQRVLTMKPGEETAQAARGYIHEIDHLQIGMPAPPFTAKTLDGKTVSLKSLHGQVVLLDFWASWCAPCIAEIPAVKEAVEQLKGKPFTVLAVSLDDDRDDVRRVVKRLKFPGYQTWDEKGWENPVQTLYNVQMIPTWYVIDGRGIIRNRDPFGEKLIPAVRAVLKQHAASRVGHPTDG